MSLIFRHSEFIILSPANKYPTHMQLFGKQPIEFTSNRVFYLIDCSKPTLILIQIEDLRKEKATEIQITGAMLLQHSTTIAELSISIHKQSLFQGSRKKHLLQHNDSSITLSFTYPKCETKPITFRVKWQYLDLDPKNQARVRLVERIMKELEETYRSSLKESQTQAKEALKQLKNQCQSLINQTKHRVNQEIIRYKDYIKYCQQDSKSYRKEQKKSLLDFNQRYFDEFRNMRFKIQDSIVTEHQNIINIDKEIQDIKNILVNQQIKQNEDRDVQMRKWKEYSEKVELTINEFRMILKNGKLASDKKISTPSFTDSNISTKLSHQKSQLKRESESPQTPRQKQRLKMLQRQANVKDFSYSEKK